MTDLRMEKTYFYNKHNPQKLIAEKTIKINNTYLDELEDLTET
jgi:hypothetical protein